VPRSCRVLPEVTFAAAIVAPHEPAGQLGGGSNKSARMAQEIRVTPRAADALMGHGKI
jgi:hypothetical protein